jgi:flagellar biosynthesis GTPase FlhF
LNHVGGGPTHSLLARYNLIPVTFLSYYRRLFRLFFHDLFRLGAAQAVGAAFAVAILVLQIYFGLIQPYVTPFGLMVTARFTRAAIISLVGPYIGLTLCLIIAVMATAAADLDNQLGSQLRDALDARKRSENSLKAAARENEEGASQLRDALDARERSENSLEAAVRKKEELASQLRDALDARERSENSLEAAVRENEELASQLRDALDARERSEKSLEAAVRENEELKKHRRTPSQQIIYDQAKNELANWGEVQLKFIRALIQREAIEHNELYRTLTGSGMSEEEWKSTVTWFRHNAGLVENSQATPFKPRDYWHINPLYREAVLELLQEAE